MPRLTGPIDLRYDAGVYYVLGTSLAEGHGYRLLNEPGAIEAIQYPPLLPMLVAAHQWLVGSADPAIVGPALRLTYLAIFCVYALAVHALARRWLAPGWALVASLLVILNLQLLWLSDTLFAELPFACVTVLFLLVAERDERRGTAAVLAGAAYLLRASGLALLVAWVVDALWQRRLLEGALRAGLAALPIVAWHAYVAEVERRPAFSAPAYAYQRAPYNFYNVGYGANLAYVDPFVPERGRAGAGDLVRRVVGNLLTLPEKLGASVSVRAEGPRHPIFRLHREEPPASRALAFGRAGFALIGLVAAGGVAMLVADGIRLTPLVWAAALGLTALAPWPSQLGRYLMPLAPVTAIGLALVLANASRIASGIAQAATGAVVGMMLAAEVLVLGVAFGSRSHQLFFYGPAWEEHDAALAWLADHAGPDDVVATSTPQRLYLQSGLRTVFPPFEPDPIAAERLLRAVPATWVVLDELEFLDVSRRYAEPAVAGPAGWRLVYGHSAGDPAGGPRIFRRVGP